MRQRHVGDGRREAVGRRRYDGLQCPPPVMTRRARAGGVERRQAREWGGLTAARQVARAVWSARDPDRIRREERAPAQRTLRGAVEKEKVGKAAAADAQLEGVGGGD